MKIMERNKTPFYYCLYVGKTDAKDSDGYETGEQPVTYGAPVPMEASVSPATGFSQTELFGNLIAYDKVIITDDMTCPIDEDSVLFLDKAPEYDDDNEPLYDYTVRRRSPSLNFIAFAVSKVKVS